jgi:hypothetical protein
MPILAAVTDLNSVDENLRGLYTERNGKFVLNVQPSEGFELDNVQGLKTALGAERQTKRDLEERVKSLGDIDPSEARNALKKLKDFEGLDPTDVRTKLESFDKLSKLDPTKEAERLAQEKIAATESTLKTALQARETELKNEVEKERETNKKLEAQLKKLMVDNAIKSKLSKMSPLDEAADMIEMLAANRVRTRKKDGVFSTEVVDDQGNRLMKDVLNDVPMTVDDLLDEIKKSRPSLFKAEQKAAIGMTVGNHGVQSPSSTNNPWKAGPSFNRTEQHKTMISNPELARKLKAEAGVRT